MRQDFAFEVGFYVFLERDVSVSRRLASGCCFAFEFAFFRENDFAFFVAEGTFDGYLAVAKVVVVKYFADDYILFRAIYRDFSGFVVLEIPYIFVISAMWSGRFSSPSPIWFRLLPRLLRILT